MEVFRQALVLNYKAGDEFQHTVSSHIRALQDKIELALNQGNQLEL